MSNSHHVKHVIAEAVHRAVCGITGDDGCGQCMLYAAVGSALAAKVLGGCYFPQAGRLYLLADPPDGVVGFEQLNLELGEFHCWFGRTESNTSGPAAELVDLSARHYRRMVERLQMAEIVQGEGYTVYVPANDDKRINWTRPDDPPLFIWDSVWPSDLMWTIPDEAATRTVIQQILDHRDVYADLVESAARYFTDLSSRLPAPRQAISQFPEGETISPQVRIGRNSPCPCGSGRKFKKCCGHSGPAVHRSSQLLDRDEEEVQR